MARAQDMRIEIPKKKNVHLGDGGRRAEEEVLLWMGLGQVLLPGGSPHIHLESTINPHIHLQNAINPKGAIIHIVCTAYIRKYPHNSNASNVERANTGIAHTWCHIQPNIYRHNSNGSSVLEEDQPGGSGPVGAPERAYLADKNHFSLLCSSWNINIGRLSGTSKRVAIEVC